MTIHLLHATWRAPQGWLSLWAESDAPGQPNLRANQRKFPGVPAHPFAAAGHSLGIMAGELGGGLQADLGHDAPIALRLPSSKSEPQASSPLLGREVITPDRLQAWCVPAFTLDASGAFDLLRALPSQPPPGLAFGHDLRYWMQTYALVVEIIAAQRFAPTLIEVGGEHQARWEATLSDADDERLHQLAAAMPPLCRAQLVQGDETPGALALLRNFIHGLVDAFVRGAIGHTGEAGKRATAAERWLYALGSRDPIVTLKGKADLTFAADLHAWLGNLHATRNAAFRTCFRLEQPDANGKRAAWQLTYHLQANDDRSVLVPAAQVWREGGSTLKFLKRRWDNPQEHLLASLGRAARMSKPIDASLRDPAPTGARLDTTQAYAFLRESAPVLEQSGFGVLLPQWWRKPNMKLGVKLNVKGKSKTASGLLGMNSIVQYDWQIALGDQTLSYAEFMKLAQLKTPLVQVRGQWVELKPEMMEQALKFFARHDGGEMTLGEALQTGLGHAESETGLPVTEIEADGWMADFLDTLRSGDKVPLIEPPDEFHGALRPYQTRGLSWMSWLLQFGLGACLADDMGLGKTPQFLALLLRLREQGALDKPALLVCPMSIVGNWQREAAKFAPALSVMAHHGGGRETGATFAKLAGRHDLVLTTYQLAARDEAHLAQVNWGVLALDEAQNIKNAEAKQTQAIRRLKAERFVALTGTPVENRLSELWSIMDFLNRGYLGSQREFQRRFAAPIERYRDTTQAEALKRLTQPFILRRVKTDKAIIADLPDKLEMKVLCNLTSEQATLYEAVVKDMLRKIEEAEGGIQRKGLVLATLLRLKQVCNHPAHYLSDGSMLPDRSGKLQRLEEMLDEALAAGDKSLVFSQFSEMGEMLRGHLQTRFGREVFFLHGGVPKKKRDEMVQRFQNEPDGAPIFILSLKAGGVGLNLTAASHVFHFDRWWNPAVENQATDRAFRIGQKKNVQVHKFICAGTVEEKIDVMIESKKELASLVVGAGENWLTELSTDQLRDLFTLERDHALV